MPVLGHPVSATRDTDGRICAFGRVHGAATKAWQGAGTALRPLGRGSFPPIREQETRPAFPPPVRDGSTQNGRSGKNAGQRVPWARRALAAGFWPPAGQGSAWRCGRGDGPCQDAQSARRRKRFPLCGQAAPAVSAFSAPCSAFGKGIPDQRQRGSGPRLSARIGCVAKDLACDQSPQTALHGRAAGHPALCACDCADAVFGRGQVLTRPTYIPAADCAPHPVPGRRGRAHPDGRARLWQHRVQPLHGGRGTDGRLRCSGRCPAHSAQPVAPRIRVG